MKVTCNDCGWGHPQYNGLQASPELDLWKEGLGLGEGIYCSGTWDELIVTDGYTGREPKGHGCWFGGDADRLMGNGNGAGDPLPCSDPDRDRLYDE